MPDTPAVQQPNTTQHNGMSNVLSAVVDIVYLFFSIPGTIVHYLHSASCVPLDTNA